MKRMHDPLLRAFVYLHAYDIMVYAQLVKMLRTNVYTLWTVISQLKMGSYSSTTMCQYWDNRLFTEQYTDYFTAVTVTYMH